MTKKESILAILVLVMLGLMLWQSINIIKLQTEVDDKTHLVVVLSQSFGQCTTDFEGMTIMKNQCVSALSKIKTEGWDPKKEKQEKTLKETVPRVVPQLVPPKAKKIYASN